ncbi:MAG TPA: hypothetical protein VMV31_08040 [Terriglobales bacterium]|nr:hypothetical protein [Terriglobales bacterium]
MSPRPWLLLPLCLLLLPRGLAAQDPASSSDHPPGNVNELTLAAIRPGRDRLATVLARWGRAFTHPSPDEGDVYVWCDARQRLQFSVENSAQGARHDTIQAVTVNRLLGPLPPHCAAHLPAALARTGRGVRLGDTAQQLKQVYGKPFFDGPASWDGRDVHLIVFNFSWAGSDRPQILESSFDAAGRLVKLTLSAQYY